MKALRVVKYLTWAGMFAIGGRYLWLLWAIKHGTRQASIQDVNDAFGMLFVAVFLMFVATVIDQTERRKRYNDFFGPLKASYARHYPKRHASMSSHFVVDSVARAAAAALAFEAAWEECVGESRPYYGKVFAASEVLDWYTRVSEQVFEETPMVLHGMKEGRS